MGLSIFILKVLPEIVSTPWATRLQFEIGVADGVGVFDDVGVKEGVGV